MTTPTISVATPTISVASPTISVATPTSSVAGPTISVVVTAYNAEHYIGEALSAVLSQTRAPDEVIVIDDGSTDGTRLEIERLGGSIRVVSQPNRGHACALNRGFDLARGDYLAKCDADDVWEPRKLQWQAQAIEANPAADVLFGHARLFGRVEAEHVRPPGTGMLDGAALARSLYLENCVFSPSTVIRRELYRQLGPFLEGFDAEDYEYWFRALRAGACFYYDPRPLVRHRRHEHNVTNRDASLREAMHVVRSRYADVIGDSALTRRTLARDLFQIGRAYVEEGEPLRARGAFVRSLRHSGGASAAAERRAIAWIAILSLPAGPRGRLGRALTRLSRALDGLRGGRNPALP